MREEFCFLTFVREVSGSRQKDPASAALPVSLKSECAASGAHTSPWKANPASSGLRQQWSPPRVRPIHLCGFSSCAREASVSWCAESWSQSDCLKNLREQRTPAPAPSCALQRCSPALQETWQPWPGPRLAHPAFASGGSPWGKITVTGLYRRGCAFETED